MPREPALGYSPSRGAPLASSAHLYVRPHLKLQRYSLVRYAVGRRSTGHVLCLALLIVQAGCGTASGSNGGWAYVGTDRALQAPLLTMDKRLSSEENTKVAQAAVEAWRQMGSQVLARDKAGCRNETAGSPAPSAVLGYSQGFYTCMRSRGWQRASNPL